MKKVSLPALNGLKTSPRRVGEGEKGFLIACKNVVPKDGGVLQQREARVDVTGSLDPADLYDRMFYNPANESVYISTTRAGQPRIAVFDGTSNWTTLTTAVGANAHIMSKSLDIFQTTLGAMRVNNDGDKIIPLGLPEAIDLNNRSDLETTPGWLGVSNSVAYYACYKTTLPDGRVVRSAPSGRLVVSTGTAGGANPGLQINLAWELDAIFDVDSTFPVSVELYRTEAQPPDTTTGALIDPGREAQLVREFPISAAAVALRSFTYVDTLSVANGEALYTNPSQQGIANSNLQCPAAFALGSTSSFATIGNVVVASSYLPKANLPLTLMAVHPDGSMGDEAADLGWGYRNVTVSTTNGNATITVTSGWNAHFDVGQLVTGSGIPAGARIQSLNSGANQVTLTAAATATAAGVAVIFRDYMNFTNDLEYYAGPTQDLTNRYIAVASSGNKSVSDTALNIATTISLISTKQAVNYISDSDENQGQMNFRMISRADTPCVFTTNRPSAFAPNNNGASIEFTSLGSGTDTLAWSKEGEPWAWPPDNTIQVPHGATVVGLSALRDSIIVWTNRGAYLFFGTYGNYGITAIDLSTWCASDANALIYSGSESLANVAIGRTKKGLIAAGETSVDSLSVNVDNMLTSYPDTFGQMFVNRAEDLVYIPLDNSILVYSIPYKCWTFYDGACLSGVYASHNNRMWFSMDDGVYYSKLNRNEVSYEEGDPTAINIDSISSNVLTVNTNLTALAQEGDIIKQGATTAVISAVTATTVTVTSAAGLTTGAASFQPVVDAYVTFCPVEAEGASITKHNQYATLVFDGGSLSVNGLASDGDYDYQGTAYPKYVALSVTTNLNSTPSTVDDVMDSTNFPHIKRFIMPLAAQRSSTFTPTVTMRGPSPIRFVSLDIDYEPVSQNVSK